jgi:uncharacterized protein
VEVTFSNPVPRHRRIFAGAHPAETSLVASLPKQHALVFGTSVNLPTSFKVREALPRPRSDDTKIVDLWFHEEGRLVDIRLSPGARHAADEDEPDGPNDEPE